MPAERPQRGLMCIARLCRFRSEAEKEPRVLTRGVRDPNMASSPKGTHNNRKANLVTLCAMMCDPFGVGYLEGCHPPQVKTCGYCSATPLGSFSEVSKHSFHICGSMLQYSDINAFVQLYQYSRAAMSLLPFSKLT